MNTNQILFLLIIIILALGIPTVFNIQHILLENYQNYQNYQSYNLDTNHLANSGGKYPFSSTDVLLEDSFPLTGRKGISNNSAYKIWWHYPIFEVGSYAQITNNLKYPNNPDEGTCMPASICGALYKEKQLKTNYIKPLPPIDPNCGTRIGYFTTDVNLLPFRTDTPNILY